MEIEEDRFDKRVKRIVKYLNRKTGRFGKYQFNYRGYACRRLIRFRFEEGFLPEDFKYVIDIKVADWLYDTKMSKYLRPTTLFGNRFKKYLKQLPATILSGNRFKKYTKQLPEDK